MFKNCIVRKPCKALVNGITSGLYPGVPDFELAKKQHAHYIECLKQCGVEVEVLEPLEEYPDSVFVEDPAVVTRSLSLIHISEPTRQAEISYAVFCLKKKNKIN